MEPNDINEQNPEQEATEGIGDETPEPEQEGISSDQQDVVIG